MRNPRHRFRSTTIRISRALLPLDEVMGGEQLTRYGKLKVRAA